jgi:ribonuclease HI
MATMTTQATLRIHTDGASRGNPGKAAYAYVIEPENGDPIEEAGCLGTMTNNQAEYTALVRALEHALELGRNHHLLIHSDSELLVKQLSGEYKVKNEDLRDLFLQAQDLRKRFAGGVSIKHVRREQNRRADALCNEALDGKRLQSARDVIKSKTAVLPESGAAKPNLDDQALGVLKAAAAAWQQGRHDPSIETVWRNLVHVLERHHVKFPAHPGRDGRATV